MTENTESTESQAENKHPLAAKIDSSEKFSEALSVLIDGDKLREILPANQQTSGVASLLRSPSSSVEGAESFGYDGGGMVTDWWLKREMYREANGVYEPATEVLAGIRQYYGVLSLFPHISTKVPGEIAYTASRRDGENDRQVRTTLGKFLSKFCPLLTDKAIAALVAAHIAELDSTFLIATTKDEITHVYTTMRGDSGCMRYSAEHFGTGVHPSAAYEYEGLAVAYLTNAEGDIIARSVIYQNPDDPTDKRYVRNYGVRTLGRKLERQGYRLAGLAGAKLRYYKRPKAAKQVVVPYLDPAGGASSGADNTWNGAYVIHFEGDDFLTVLTDNMASRAEKLGLHTGYAKVSNAIVELTSNKKADSLETTCALSGKTANRLFDEMMPIFRTVEAGVEYALISPAIQAGFEYGANRAYKVAGSWKTQTVYVTEATRANTHSGYLDTPETWEYRGYYLLDPELYPNATGRDRYVEGEYYGAFVREVDGVRYYARRADCVRYVDDNAVTQWLHVSKKTDDMVQIIPNLTDDSMLAFKTNPRLIRTMGHKYAVLGYSRVMLHSSGKYCGVSTGTAFGAFGMSFRIHEGNTSNCTPAFYDEAVRRLKEKWERDGYDLEIRTHRRDSLLQAAHKSVGSTTVPQISSSGLAPRSSWYTYGYDRLVQAYTRAKQMKAAGVPLNVNDTIAACWEFWFQILDRFMPDLLKENDDWRAYADATPEFVPPAPVVITEPTPVTELVIQAEPVSANADDALLDRLLNEPIQAAPVADMTWNTIYTNAA